ncbi:sigma-70 family RNA polymerase sigma factor [Thermodesulfovibrio thiophilus]|uniref:sigma-70 family RNA polymerase sigma factor n=1 Tax=Thermodesulfovibrio thiophilus TaxID=340095 RepID=UPI0004246FA9|nr:sigma-70 family RNA polymerase sigma factor [Thermodesulfovibrio thiophilus]
MQLILDETITEEQCSEIQDMIKTDCKVQKFLRQSRFYISGLEYKDLEHEAFCTAMEVLHECRDLFCCSECNNIRSCEIFKTNFKTRLVRTINRLKDIPRRYGMISYSEASDGENDEFATYTRKDYDINELSPDTPVEILIHEEEKEQEEKGLEIKKQLTAGILAVMPKKERTIWELYLAGVHPSEIADRLGYKKPQGVYVILRRSVNKVKIKKYQ